MMTRAFRDKWADALETGGFLSCQLYLTSIGDDGICRNCALGVGMYVAGIKATGSMAIDGDEVFVFDGAHLMPNASQLEILGLTADEALDIAFRSDGTGEYADSHTFSEIATYLRTLPVRD